MMEYGTEKKQVVWETEGERGGRDEKLRRMEKEREGWREIEKEKGED